MRRLLGGLPLLALLAASPARTAGDPPVPSTPADALALLKWCWENRDIARYHELFTENFRYIFADGDSSGAAYRTTPWGRADELASATGLFVGGSPTQAPASGITLTFTADPQPATHSFPGLTYPWHQQLVVPWTLDIARTDGSTLNAGGQSLWFLVRGDSAVIPQELKDRGFSPDPGRWYVERWAEEADTPPIVRAPSEASGKALAPITVQITAQDPDGDPIASLSAESGVSSNFYPTADHTAGTFAWIPRQVDVGSHLVTFRAANALTGSATTTIKVLPPNLYPIASLAVKPPGGAEPLGVTADASGSSDADGRIDSYQFDFGDGLTLKRSVPVATHTYKAGIWPLTLTVTDDDGATASASARITVTAPPLVASLVLSPSSGVAPLDVTADASRSSDVDSPIASYRFDFGDGTVVGPQPGATATHTYAAGTWTAKVTVTDSGGATATASATVTVAPEGSQPPVAKLVVTPASGTEPLAVTADASGSNDPDGPIASYRFDFGDGTVVGPQSSPTATHTYAAGQWTATVRVADSNGATASAAATITVAAAPDPLSTLPNLVWNPSFEVDTVGWRGWAGSTIERVAGGYDGLYALQMTGPAVIAGSFGVNDSPDWIRPTAAAGERYRFTARVRSPGSRGTAGIWVREYLLATNARLGMVSSAGVPLSPAWQTLEVDYTTLSAGSTLDFQVREFPLAPGEVFLTDDISIRDITAPVASLVVSPISGVAPLDVSADASRSSDVDSPIASYQFDFGDGTVVGPQSSPTATHTYAAGHWTATVRVADLNGATASAAATITVTAAPDPVSTLPNLVRNSSFEVDAAGWRGWAGSTIERVAGGYDGLYALQMTGPPVIAWGFGVNDSPDWIRPTAAAGERYRFTARVRSPGSRGTARIRVREYLLATNAGLGMVSSVGVPLAPAWQTLEVDYTTLSAGSTLDFQVKELPLAPGEVFLTDDVSIRDITGVAGIARAEGEFVSEPHEDGEFVPEPDEERPLRPGIYPSPVQTQAVLTFTTSRPGALRVDLLDLAGRQVRRLADEIDSPPGSHVLTIDGTGDDGQRMRPGMYFYRIVAEEGRRTGRFVMLR